MWRRAQLVELSCNRKLGYLNGTWRHREFVPPHSLWLWEGLLEIERWKWQRASKLKIPIWYSKLVSFEKRTAIPIEATYQIFSDTCTSDQECSVHSFIKTDIIRCPPHWILRLQLCILNTEPQMASIPAGSSRQHRVYSVHQEKPNLQICSDLSKWDEKTWNLCD